MKQELSKSFFWTKKFFWPKNVFSGRPVDGRPPTPPLMQYIEEAVYRGSRKLF